MWLNISEDFDGELGRKDEGLSNPREGPWLCGVEPPFVRFEALGGWKLMADCNWKLNEHKDQLLNTRI